MTDRQELVDAVVTSKSNLGLQICIWIEKALLPKDTIFRNGYFFVDKTGRNMFSLDFDPKVLVWIVEF